MTISRVRLQNWKSHLDSEFEFSPGVNALIGIMGSGKSSVMDAISFALFGTLPAHKSRAIGLDDLVMKKPQRKKEASVEIEFRVGNNTYNVKRAIEPGKGTTRAEIRRNGELVEVSPHGVNRVVEDVLQMDYDLFSKAVYSEQNGLDFFLRVPKGKRMEYIDRMLKVDRFEDARSNTVSLRNTVISRKEEMLRVIEDMKRENLADRLEEAKSELASLKEKSLILGNRKATIAKSKSSVSDEVSALESKEEELNIVKEKLEGLKFSLAEIEKTLNRRKEKLEGRDLEKIEEELEKSAKEISELKKQVKETEKSVTETRENIAGLNTEVKLLDDSLKELHDAGEKCPVCDSRLTKEKKENLVKDKKAKNRELREKISSLVSSIEKSSERKERLEAKLEKMLENKLSLEKISSDIDEIKELEKRLGEQQKESRKLSNEKEAMEKGFRKDDLKELRKELQEIISNESRLLQEISDLQERIGDKEQVLKDLKERMDMLLKYTKQVEKSRLIAEQLSGFEKALKITQDQLREEFLKTVNSTMGAIWPELYPYDDFQGIQLAVESGDYVLQLKESGGWISVEGSVSGGERSMACLALRIAFSLAFIPNLKWLILDEPTHNLDENAIKQLSEILRERVNQFAEQVFLITHEEKISEAVTGNLYRLERNKELDEPTKIVAV